MFIVSLGEDCYKKAMNIKCSDLEIPLGSSLVHNGLSYNPIIVVEKISEKPNDRDRLEHQLWLKRNEKWFNIENRLEKVFKMNKVPSMPRLVVYQAEGKKVCIALNLV